MPNENATLDLELLSGDFSVCRLDTDSPCPQYSGGALFSVTYTADELSILCDTANVPDATKAEHGFVAIKVAGPLDFSLIGILADLTTTLAAANVSVFVISTFDTDYVLCKREKFTIAIEHLTAAGHRLSG